MQALTSHRTNPLYILARHTEMMIELGLDTFGDVVLGNDGRPVTQAQALRNVVAEGVLADALGIDAFGVGEHHRADFAVSAPEVVLAAIAGKTERIRLGSAVTVLSSDDPVRVFQRFSTLNALSNGRAEVILGRGSFTESFPLFGYDLSQDNELFEEKLARFAQLLEQAPIVYPPVENGRLRTWVGVGGSPESVVRAARYGLPLTLAIIGGSARRFLTFVDLYQRKLKEFGKPPQPVGVHSPGHVAETDDQAREELWPHYLAMMELHWPRARLASSRPRRLRARSRTRRRLVCRRAGNCGGEDHPHGQGSRPLAVSISRYSNGTLPHESLMKSIELFGTKVIPLVRAEVDSLAGPKFTQRRYDAGNL